MCLTCRVVRTGLALVALAAGGTARAQSSMAGGSTSLGGYGGSMSSSASGMSGPVVIPYAGQFGGFMPYRMSGGSLSFQSRGTSAVSSGRTSFSLSSMSVGMSSMSGGMGRISGMGGRAFTPLGSTGGVGMGGSMSIKPGSGRMSVMPPSFGFPFREPPSVVAPAAASMGMSM